ncbi:MAG: LacI family DNA-binding transcriptional regulator [Lentisphaeria bacterium]|nr:LacI family DNA-binding transcriptional regulator [Lentisphaeria bacterium]
MRTRLKDIARQLDCSLQTVSLVMNGKYHGRVTEARAREVRETAEKMGYVVNFSAGCLRGKRSHAVGVIQPAVSPGGFPDLAATVARHLQKSGYQVYFYIQDADGTNREAITSLVSRGVEGVILLDCYNIVPHRDELCPVLAVGSMANSEISVDKRSGVRNAAAHLIRCHGHRKIGFVTNGSRFSLSSAEKLDGVRLGLADADLEFAPEFCVDVSRVADCEARLRKLVVESGVTAFCCANDYVAGRLISYLTRRGVRVPEDVAVVGFDGLNFGEFSQVPLATVVQPFELLGRRTVEIMLDRISGIAPSGRTELLAPAFRPGPSCGCPLPHEPVLPMVEWLGLSYDQSDPVYAGELAGFVSPNQHPLYFFSREKK